MNPKLKIWMFTEALHLQAMPNNFRQPRNTSTTRKFHATGGYSVSTLATTATILTNGTLKVAPKKRENFKNN